MDNQRLYTIALSHCEQLGPVHYQRLITSFGSAEAAWNASATELLMRGFTEFFTREFSAAQSRLPDVHLLYERMIGAGVSVVLRGDQEYPKALLDLHDPPFILYYRGILPSADERLVAVVGTRRCSAYGIHAAQTLCAEIAEEKCTIVSGLALGIDAFAHRAALDGGTRAIAVLGGGVDRSSIGPRQNLALAEEIIAHGGCVLSEYPSGSRPFKTHFPMRNRIVAGLCAGVLIIEAPIKSGALITADIALNLGREVFAVPGNITSPLSEGANILIQNGAHVVLCGRDIIETLGFASVKKQLPHLGVAAAEFSAAERVIHDALAAQSLHAEEIASRCHLDIATANSTLLRMEMKGLVAHIGGMVYAKK